MSQAPELAGGAGFTFEDRTSAFYLAALLQQGFAPGIGDRTVCRVALQQRDFGEPLDDVIVDFQTDQGNIARLSLQVKRALSISRAPTNTDFRDVIRDCWSTFKKEDFRNGNDRYGAAVNQVATTKARDLQTLCELARVSSTLTEFETRFTSDGNASASVSRIKNDIAALIESVTGSPCSGEDLKDFLAHFVLIKLDFLHEGQVDLPSALNGLRACLAAGEAAQVLALWDRLCTTAREGAGRSAVFSRPELVRSVSTTFRLMAAPRLRQDLELLRGLARQWVADIEDDVGGTRLERPDLSADLEKKLQTSRWVQIRGLPGSGKSVLLRRRVEADLASGPVFFLKSGRLEGTSWVSFATANGISSTHLPELLVELAATGSNSLYIDGIDRIEKQHQRIILDVVRAVMEDPLLDDWRVVVSLRDSSIEQLRNWLGNALSNSSVESVEVNALNDNEAELLAEAKPHLRPLLFGSRQVQEIVRRPFFAKILNQNFGSSVGDDAFHPQSEIDLIENWWARGGYDADGQIALERQRAIVNLGSQRARHFGRDIALRDLSAPTRGVTGQLVTDGILQHSKVGHSLRFSHDIFFEWAFFHVLNDAEDWLKEIRACGEPPAVARVVELLSQSEFGRGDIWTTTLHTIDGSSMRSQWTRAWLLAPLSAPTFSAKEGTFSKALEADDHRFLNKALVWFQAERTTPNLMVLDGDFPEEERTRLADLLGWPSDSKTWARFIAFLLTRISTIPVELYPNAISIFEVWQNAFYDIKNRISDALLDQTAVWLRELAEQRTAPRQSRVPSRWDPLRHELGDLKSSLTGLIFRAAQARPDLANELLNRMMRSEGIRRQEYSELVGFSPVLARSHAELLVDLSLKFFLRELPEAHRQREQKELKQGAKRRKRALAKPSDERTRADEMTIHAGLSLIGGHEFGRYDWQRLSLEDGLNAYSPPSPLREPFRSLFAFAPEQALRLVTELSNHAMTAWRQLHRLALDTPGTPVPLEIEFPWGKQQFWGADREYLWFRGMWAPPPISCAYLALEEWAFSEVERGRPVEELIRLLVSDNHCIAVLGVATAVALETEAVSDAIFPVVTSQRLIAADYNRMLQDRINSGSRLIGFSGRSDFEHVKAIERANNRSVRHRDLRSLVSLFFLDATFRERTKAAVLAFVDALPYQIEEHRSNLEAQEHLRKQALEYAEMVDIGTYQKVPMPEGDERIAIVHVSPTAASPEKVAKAEEASVRLREGNLWAWASRYFETGQLREGLTVQSAISLAKDVNGADLFESLNDDADMTDMRRGAVAAAAAVALDQRADVSSSDLAWARKILKRAISAPEMRDNLWSPRSDIPWHHAIFAAKGLAADLRNGTAQHKAAYDLLTLVAHPLEAVSLTALDAALSLWDQNPRLGWSALHLALSLCVLPPRSEHMGPSDEIHSRERVRSAIKHATHIYENGEGWVALPLPPPAWIREEDQGQPVERRYGTLDASDLVDPREHWAPSKIQWYDQYAAQVIKCIPLAQVMQSTAAPMLLDLLSGQLAWTISKVSPHWILEGRRDRIDAQLHEWTHGLGSVLGQVAGLCPLSEAEARFLAPIFALDDDQCWELLAPFVDLFIASFIYDSEEMPSGATELLLQCLDRFLEASEFDPENHHSGELHGFDQPSIARALMFVAITEPVGGAVRYANGDWSEIERIVPVVDRFVRSAGWASTIMSNFLQLCELAKEIYPAEQFADQILHVIDSSGPPLKSSDSTMLAARIAGLVQSFAHRETPMSLELGQKLLRILDLLVDMGDRRSAALQLSESFREIQVAAKES